MGSHRIKGGRGAGEQPAICSETLGFAEIRDTVLVDEMTGQEGLHFHETLPLRPPRPPSSGDMRLSGVGGM